MLKMLLIPSSGNVKTGKVIATYTEDKSCPTRCPFKGQGCYGEAYHTARAWRRCKNDLDTRQVSDRETLKVALEMAARVQSKSNSVVVFRHNVAGDLSKDGETIDKETLNALIGSVSNARTVLGKMGKEFLAYTYTHCDVNTNHEAIKDSISNGFVINASCETVEETFNAVSMGLPAVLTTFDVDSDIKALKDLGVKSFQCPAQTKGKTCAECKLCARKREVVVLFQVHGNSKKKATKAIEDKRVIMLRVEK